MEQEISYTVEEVAGLLKVSKLTVYDLIKKGKLPSFKVGRQMRIQSKDLQLFINGKKAPRNIESMPITTQEYAHQGKSAKRKILISGQDVVLDILGKQLETNGDLTALRSNEGSLNGLMNMYKRDCDIVSLHMFDGDSGEYNLPYVRKVLIGHSYIILNLLSRKAGLMVQKGNPFSVKGWLDLKNQKLRFINREIGSGARILLEEQLRLNDISPSLVNGYQQVESSHLGVASAIAAGRADVGVGIEKVAKMVDLDFIPLIIERYDLVLLKTPENKELISRVKAIMKKQSFKDEITSLGNYDTAQTGMILYETND
ncbi:substrate-binding domain-containing protein [Alkalihalobacillus sp. 1P02AB]|uniref:substrate-binding domain-containing protein n=1 Tax=Alkalihalobacillus sp. 1P02AB TaxID=3132260 RepID=UPI0039A726E7